MWIRLLAVLLVLAPLAPLAAAAEPDHVVRVRFDQPGYSGAVGDTVIVTAIVRNTGTAVVHVALDAPVPDWLSARVEPPGVERLRPNEEATFRLPIEILRWAPTGTWAIRVHTIVLEDVAASVASDIQLNIAEPRPARANETYRGPYPGPLPPTPRVLLAEDGPALQVAPGSLGEDALLVANTGPEPRTLLLDIGNTPGWNPHGLLVAFDSSRVEVPPGASVRVPLRVRAPDTAPLGHEQGVDVHVRILGENVNRTITFRIHVVDGLPSAEKTLVAGLVAAAAIAAVAATTAALRRRDDWRWAAILPLLPLFTRLAKSEVLDHRTRERVHELVRARPGIFWHEIKKETALPTGVLVHHLRTLEKHGFLVAHRAGRRLRFYPAGERRPEAPPRDEPLSEGQREILAILEPGPMTQKEIARMMGLTQQAVSYHLRKLESRGRLLVEVGDDGVRRYRAVVELLPE